MTREVRGEPSDAEDFDRELSELTSDLRVLLPGVAVLFAFLLTVPFSSRFASLRDIERGAYFLAFLAAALAVVLLGGASAYHRMIGKPYDKRSLIRAANLQAVAGLIAFATSLVAVVLLVSDMLFSGLAVTLLTGTVALVALLVWFALPLARRYQWRRSHLDGCKDRDASRRANSG